MPTNKGENAQISVTTKEIEEAFYEDDKANIYKMFDFEPPKQETP